MNRNGPRPGARARATRWSLQLLHRRSKRCAVRNATRSADSHAHAPRISGGTACSPCRNSLATCKSCCGHFASCSHAAESRPRTPSLSLHAPRPILRTPSDKWSCWLRSTTSDASHAASYALRRVPEVPFDRCRTTAPLPFPALDIRRREAVQATTTPRIARPREAGSQRPRALCESFDSEQFAVQG